ncbi:SpaA isopeptide-forming pilin-related protein [Paenibacillus sp. 1P07SE]|uniref:SpaA isopeptide-forming pilin-related protein n=1 Tax=Paenibacillus sp. 1P07SE TaxID=3132209 RepID=UPI0039A435FF
MVDDPIQSESFHHPMQRKVEENTVRKYAKILFMCVLVVALQVSSISNVLFTYASGTGNDVTSEVASQFITGVDIREKAGSMPGNTLVGTPDLEKDTDFMLFYEFEVPNVHTIVEGDYIILDVPPAIKLPELGPGQEVYLTNLDIEDVGTTVASAYLMAGNQIKLVFSDSVETLSNVGGAFFLAGNFDEAHINEDGTATDISFGIPNQTLSLSFKAAPVPDPDPVTVQKDGALVNGTDIAWTITVNKENVAVANAVLVDPIPGSQVLDPSSIEVNGAAVSPDAIVLGEDSLSIVLGDITTQQEVTFRTSLKEAALLAALEAGETSIAVTNTAYLEHDDDKTTNVDSPKTVTIPLNILSKSGHYDSTTTANNTKNILWTIVVNQDELAFTNALIQDTLPAGLTYIPGTATIDGASVTPGENGSELTFNLGNISEEVTITYETQIDPARFQANGSYTFRNEAVLTWEGLTGAGVMKEGSVGVGSNLFTKSGAGYNRANGVISWSITINSDHINLEAPTITDVIPSTQQYIEGSARIVDHQNNAYAGGTFTYDAGTSTLSYVFDAAINSRYTITFDTKPSSTEDITANASGSFSNTATFSSGTINRSSTGTQSYTSNVLKKDAQGYDLDVANRTITWRLTVNENGATTASAAKAGTDASLYNAIALPNVSIVDAIPDGLTFLPDTVSVRDLGGNPVANLVTVSGTDVVTFEFNSSITEQYTIEFKTAITDLSKFISQNNTLNNGNFNVTNEATLTHDHTTRSNTDPATQTIRNHIVSKKGIPTAFGNKYVDWVVYLNSNAVDLNQLLDVDSFWLIDNLQAGLELDTTSVELIEYSGAIIVPDNIPANGNDGLGAGTSIPLDGSHIVYDATTREFRFNFPTDTIETAYKLSFRTYVTETVTSGTSFTNSINLFGSKEGVAVPIEGAYQSSDGRTVTFLQAGSIGYGNLGQFIVHKVDSDDPSVSLSGATFALYDQYGNKVQEKATVDGELEFNRIKFDLPYYIKEVEAPTGYLLSGNVSVDGTPATPTPTGAVVEDAIPLTLTASHTPKYLELVFANEQIRADIQFIKQTEAGNPLAGAQFGLFPRGADAAATPLATAGSNSLGVVAFADVAYGEYDIREMQAPDGYRTLTGVVRAVEVTAADHDTTLTLDPVSNSLIRANLSLVKRDDSGSALAGAEFTLYNSSDEAIATETSDALGAVLFENVLAGNYNIRETGTPFGYIPITGNINSTPIAITEAVHGTTISLGNVTNELIQADISFVKQDENGQALAEAVFGLYDSQDTLVQSQTSLANGTVTFTNIGEGSYTIRETSAPHGYVPLTGDVHTVTVAASNHNTMITLDPVANTLVEADIEFVKVNDKGEELPGAEFELVDHNGNVVDTVISDAEGKVTFVDVRVGDYTIREKTPPVGYNPIDGDVATVQITAAEHGTTVTHLTSSTLPQYVTNNIIKGHIEFVKIAKTSGTLLQHARFALYDANDTAFTNELAVAISDGNGVVRFEDVEYGDYIIREIVAPGGYNRSNETLTVSVTQEGETYDLGTFENTAMPVNIILGTIEVKKVNEFGDSLAGAKFGLYNAWGHFIGEAVTNHSGMARFYSLTEGTYTIKELEAPANYVKTDQEKQVIISRTSNVESVTIVNERSSDTPWSSVTVQKVDDAGVKLAGVTFGLYQATDIGFTTPFASSTTNAEGKATFANLPVGQYVVKEIEALEGYILSNATLPVTVAEDGKTYHAGTIENKAIRGDIVITKVNERNETLQGAQFGLYDSNGKLVGTATSNSAGMASFEAIPYGSYELKELAAPASYTKSDAVIPVNITRDGSVHTFTVVNIKGDDVSGDTDAGNGTGGESPTGTGAGTDTGSNTGAGGDSGESDIDTDVKSGNMGMGGNTSVPDGTLTGNNGAAVGGVNHRNELPKTGDAITVMMWLFAGSGLLILILLVTGRRKAQKQ